MDISVLVQRIWDDRNSDDVKRYDGTRVTVDREMLVELVRSLGGRAYILTSNSQVDNA
jgi:hypothetical protein